MSMMIQIRKLADMLGKQAVNDTQYDDDFQVRRARLAAKQKAMFDQMIADGTHIYCKTNYTRGDSSVLRDAGLVK